MSAVPRVAGISAVLALMLAAVWFWPSTLGGGTTYVVTHGTSMEPGFSTGDLAILRPASAYDVGDVVAYRSSSLDTIVMHRIVAGDVDGFVTQGDNNDWLDEDRPAQDELLGGLFIRIPQGGKVLDTLRSPGVLPFAGAALVAVLGLIHRPSPRHGRSARRRRRRPAFSMPARVRRPALSMPALAFRPSFSMPERVLTTDFSMPARARARQITLVSAAVAVLGVLGLSVLVALPATQTDTRTLQVSQQGQFSYDGLAVPGTTYPTGVIATGETVWTRLATRLAVSYTSTITGPELADLRGVLRLDVVVAASDGWSAVLTSGPQATLQDGTATAGVLVDPGAAAQLLERHYAEIGTSGAGGTLTVTPVTATTGTVQGRAFEADPPTAFAFALDAGSLRPAGTTETELAPLTQTAVQVEETSPRRLSVLSVSVSVVTARIAVAVLLVTALVALAAGAWIGRTNRRDVADQFLVRHADRILPVASFDAGPAVVDVADADALHRVAERFDTLVLHHSGPDEDVFLVRDVDATYRFVVPGVPDRRRGKPPVPPSARRAPGARGPVPADAAGPLPTGGLWEGRVA